MSTDSGATGANIRLLVQIVGYIVGWLLVLRGWKIASQEGLKRDKRREVRSQLDDLVEMIGAIEIAAIEFYQHDAGDPDLSKEASQAWLVSAISKVSRRLSRLKAKNKLVCTAEVTAFRQAITSDRFYDSARKAAVHSDSVIQDISRTAVDLMEKIEYQFEIAFP